MSDLLIKVLFFALGLYAGVMSWLFKVVWSRMEDNHASIEKIKVDCATCKGNYAKDLEATMEKITERWGAMLDEKLEAWWNKIELNLVNEGRVPPRRPSKKEGN